MPTRWTDATLEAARQDGDPAADALVERILTARAGSGGVSRGGYNHLLDLAQVLVSTPELALVPTSLLRRGLDQAGEVTSFFEPMPAPDWVDEDKLKLAGELWHTDSILAIAVLYASSLPACYLMQRGVPALYQTEKLAEHKYVFQRIHETGLMLDAVMHPGGIRVVHDVEPSADEAIAKALNEVDPEGQWEWRHHRLHRGAGHGHEPHPDHVHECFAAVRKPAARYLWGDGFIAARKVRFLHAAMRMMLLHPELMRPAAAAVSPDASSRPHSFMEQAVRRAAPWDAAALGKPINQEDLAFVLLTFAYLIPKGMESWGRKVSLEQREAFLHLWRVIGHAMGIRDDLMTDNWDEAAALYEQILRRNGGPSEPGRILTGAVMGFLRSYLPARFGLDKTAPAALIIDQLGPAWAQHIVPAPDFQAARGMRTRATVGILKTGLKCYYWIRHNVLGRLPFVGRSVADVTEQAAETLIESWRDAFRRKPFYIPSDATTWVAERGVTKAFEDKLMSWRQTLFDTIAAGLVSLIVAGFAFALAVGFFLLEMTTARNVSAGISVFLFVMAIWLLQYSLPSVANRRPRLQE